MNDRKMWEEKKKKSTPTLQNNKKQRKTKDFLRLVITSLFFPFYDYYYRILAVDDFHFKYTPYISYKYRFRSSFLTQRHLLHVLQNKKKLGIYAAPLMHSSEG